MTVHQGPCYCQQGHSVADAVVDTQQQRRSTLIPLYQVKLPKRPVRVERKHREFGQAVLQSPLRTVRTDREPFQQQMAAEVEIAVVYPYRPGRVLLHALKKSRMRQQSVLQSLEKSTVSDGRLKYPHTDDKHQIGGAVHPQEGGVHAVHALPRRPRRPARRFSIRGRRTGRRFVRRLCSPAG